MFIKVKSELLSVDTPLVMGILNLSKDSFYSGSIFPQVEDADKRIEKLLADGADMIDIGAVSTRPGLTILKQEDEWQLLEPVLNLVNKKYSNIIFSLDTVYAETSKRAVKDFGIDIINDISGGEFDKKMFETVADLDVPYILMHMRGTPENMQEKTDYENFIEDIIFYFSEKIAQLNSMGVNDIIVDPGFGFAKTVAQNFELLNNLERFKVFELPILAGLSRKTMIWKTLGITPLEALNGTTVLNTIALMKGSHILRVHDVKEAKEVVKLYCNTKKTVES
ncbi:MAG: dihydropteroate synthase [Bacteroidota bacterium]|jgi:dihydropteroate synthase|nr:dihydropteroate synthase [Bacteroidota bacterium]NLP19375.1 dihydropteroate synthase [Bacteroidales bacterium]OQC44293.1 MAG: Dihydropteroate synthase [Bacteroidetes bacterium ADurb.Bin028]HNY43818.1 dihydropteroate synthase [Bacteroidales bacterium]HOD87416.1 dihydropteroate synthase [Bacteroidales bacterium]